MSFYDRFLYFCELKGVKPSRAASDCNINRSNVTNWKNNGYTPRGDVLQRIAEYFNITVDSLLGSNYECADDENPWEIELRDAFDKLDVDSQIQAVNTVKEMANKKAPTLTSKDERNEGFQAYNPTHKIPILGRISAGLPLYAEEHIEGYTYTTLNGGAEYFALKVKGDSMNAARIYDGDTLIVRRQEVVENGQIAVVIVNDDEATVKRFYQTGTTVTLMPQSTNPIHQPQIYDAKATNIRVLGLVVKNEISF